MKPKAVLESWTSKKGHLQMIHHLKKQSLYQVNVHIFYTIFYIKTYHIVLPYSVWNIDQVKLPLLSYQVLKNLNVIFISIQWKRKSTRKGLQRFLQVMLKDLMEKREEKAEQRHQKKLATANSLIEVLKELAKK